MFNSNTPHAHFRTRKHILFQLVNVSQEEGLVLSSTGLQWVLHAEARWKSGSFAHRFFIILVKNHGDKTSVYKKTVAQ